MSLDRPELTPEPEPGDLRDALLQLVTVVEAGLYDEDLPIVPAAEFPGLEDAVQRSRRALGWPPF